MRDAAKGVLIFVLLGAGLFASALIADRMVYSYIASRVPSVTAKCADGAYSTAKTKRGACANHDGVDKWVIR